MLDLTFFGFVFHTFFSIYKKQKKETRLIANINAVYATLLGIDIYLIPRLYLRSIIWNSLTTLIICKMLNWILFGANAFTNNCDVVRRRSIIQNQSMNGEFKLLHMDRDPATFLRRTFRAFRLFWKYKDKVGHCSFKS